MVTSPPASRTPAARTASPSAARMAATRVAVAARRKRGRPKGRDDYDATEPSKRRASRSEATATDESHPPSVAYPFPARRAEEVGEIKDESTRWR